MALCLSLKLVACHALTKQTFMERSNSMGWVSASLPSPFRVPGSSPSSSALDPPPSSHIPWETADVGSSPWMPLTCVGDLDLSVWFLASGLAYFRSGLLPTVSSIWQWKSSFKKMKMYT